MATSGTPWSPLSGNKRNFVDPSVADAAVAPVLLPCSTDADRAPMSKAWRTVLPTSSAR